MFQKLTVAYIPESKDIANEYLFDRLFADSVFLASDSIYSIFYNNQKNKPVGKLHDVKEDLYVISWYDSLFKSLTGITDSLIAIKQDSIYLIDSLNEISALTNYDVLRFNLTSSLNILLQTRANLFIQRDLFVDGKISDAATKNSAVVPTKLPDINRQFMNQMQILFERYGEDSIAPYYSQILTIAQQCPYEGGPSVYVARTFVAMFTDEDEYNDDAVCLQSGIYREENKNQIQISESEISIIPNPANDKITILINGTQEGICKIEISNTLGSVILKDEMNCKEKSHSINTRNFVSGVYFVKVHLNNSPLKTAKLIIQR